MSSIAAGTTSGTALVSTGDTTGALVLQTNGTTTAVTIATNQVVTLAQPLPVASGGTGTTSLSGITTGTSTNLAGGSNGTIPYQSAAGTTQMLAVGSPGQLLQTNGAAAPTWVAASAGALTLLSTVTASASATVDIETTFDSTYDNYMIVASGITCVTSGNLQARLKIGGSYITGGAYDYHVTNQVDSSTSYSGLAAEEATSIVVLSQLDNTVKSTAGFVMYVYRPASTTLLKQVTWTGATMRQNASSSAYLNTGTGGVGDSQIAALTGVRFFMASGNITVGTFRLYGIANS